MAAGPRLTAAAVTAAVRAERGCHCTGHWHGAYTAHTTSTTGTLCHHLVLGISLLVPLLEDRVVVEVVGEVQEREVEVVVEEVGAAGLETDAPSGSPDQPAGASWFTASQEQQTGISSYIWLERGELSPTPLTPTELYNITITENFHWAPHDLPSSQLVQPSVTALNICSLISDFRPYAILFKLAKIQSPPQWRDSFTTANLALSVCAPYWKHHQESSCKSSFLVFTCYWLRLWVSEISVVCSL